MHYFALVEDQDLEDAAVLADPPASIKDENFRFTEGVPLKDWFPSDAVYPMSPEFPRARKLYALQSNALGLLVISKELKAVFDSVGCDNIEYLPISILNHRGKLASSDYSIANVLHPMDAMDRKNSIYKMNPLLPTQVNMLSKLVLLEDRIPPERHLFRLTNAPRVYLVTETLKRAVEKKKLDGMLFIPVEEFDDALH